MRPELAQRVKVFVETPTLFAMTLALRKAGILTSEGANVSTPVARCMYFMFDAPLLSFKLVDELPLVGLCPCGVRFGYE